MDIVALGALAAGGYFVFVNRDKIMSWFSSQVFGPLENAATTQITNLLTPGADLIGLPRFDVTDWGNLFCKLMPGIPGCSNSPTLSGSTAQTTPALVVYGDWISASTGLGYSGPRRTYADVPAGMTPIPGNPAILPVVAPIVAPVSSAIASISSPQLSQANANIVYSGSAPAGVSLNTAQRYAQTFAMPGSPAWIAAGL